MIWGERKVKKRPWEEAAGLAVALRARLGIPSSSSPCKQLRAFNWFTISVNERPSTGREGGRIKSEQCIKTDPYA